jgi:hypothetical protein
MSTPGNGNGNAGTGKVPNGNKGNSGTNAGSTAPNDYAKAVLDHEMSKKLLSKPGVLSDKKVVALLAQIAAVMDSDYDPAYMEIKVANLVDDLFQAAFLMHALEKGLGFKDRVEAVHKAWALSKMFTWKDGQYTPETSGAWEITNGSDTIKIGDNRKSQFVAANMSDPQDMDMAKRVYKEFANTAASMEMIQQVCSLKSLRCKLEALGILDGKSTATTVSGGARSKSKTKAAAATYKKTQRRHVDAAGVSRTVFTKGGTGRYVRTRKSDGTYRYVAV